MRSDQDIQDIVKTPGGYMKLQKDERRHYSANLKDSGVKSIQQEVEVAVTPDETEDKEAPPAATSAVTSDQIQKMIDDAVEAKTRVLQGANDDLRRASEKLSQDEFTEYTPEKPQNLGCKLRLWRETSDQEYEIITNAQHIKDALIENKDGLKLPTPTYRFTLVDYLNCKTYNWGAYNQALRRSAEIKKSLTRKADPELEKELKKYEAVIAKYAPYTRTVDMLYELPYETSSFAHFEITKTDKKLMRKGEGKVRASKTQSTMLNDEEMNTVWGASDNKHLRNKSTNEVIDAVVMMDKTYVDLVCVDKEGRDFTFTNFDIRNVNN